MSAYHCLPTPAPLLTQPCRLLTGKPYNFGLEVGSKAELVMVMSLLTDHPGANLICNGFKDKVGCSAARPVQHVSPPDASSLCQLIRCHCRLAGCRSTWSWWVEGVVMQWMAPAVCWVAGKTLWSQKSLAGDLTVACSCLSFVLLAQLKGWKLKGA